MPTELSHIYAAENGYPGTCLFLSSFICLVCVSYYHKLFGLSLLLYGVVGFFFNFHHAHNPRVNILCSTQLTKITVIVVANQYNIYRN